MIRYPYVVIIVLSKLKITQVHVRKSNFSVPTATAFRLFSLAMVWMSAEIGVMKTSRIAFLVLVL